jgi:hypothetical protein
MVVAMDLERPLTEADREVAVAALRRHAGAGAIDLDEFGDRTAAVLGASTVGELAPVFAGLPGGLPALPSEPAPPQVRPMPVRPRPSLGLPVVARLAPIAPLAILFVAIWAVTGFGYFWPVWPILGITVGTLRRGRCLGRHRGRSPHWV